MENRRIEFHPEAAEEIVGAHEWYEVRSPVAANAFTFELNRALETVLDAPERWPTDRFGLRRYLLHRFPFCIVYRLKEQVVEVIAVAHLRRKPGYWRTR